jgi:hypothetical protein
MVRSETINLAFVHTSHKATCFSVSYASPSHENEIGRQQNAALYDARGGLRLFVYARDPYLCPHPSSSHATVTDRVVYPDDPSISTSTGTCVSFSGLDLHRRHDTSESAPSSLSASSHHLPLWLSLP